MDSKKIDLFENDSIPKAVAKLSIPTVLGTLVMVLYNMADTYFVGMLADPIESAAVTLAAPMLLAFNAVNNLFGIGASSMMSRSLGKKDFDTVRKCAVFSFYSALFCALMISLLFTIFRGGMMALLGVDDITYTATARYLLWTVSCGAAPAILNVVLSNMVRSEGSAMHASVGVMSGCLLNVLLDPFFVLPQFLGMGAAGAGLATFLSNTVACSYYFVLLFMQRKKTYVSLNPRLFSIRWDIVKEVFGVGIPASIQNLLNVTGTIILNNFTAGYGEGAVAAMGIAHKIIMVPMFLCMGITQGIMPLVSYSFAKGNKQRMRDAAMFVLKIAMVLAVGITVLYFACSATIVRLFMNNDEIVAYGRILLRCMCFAIPSMVIDFLAVGIFQAIGKGKYSLVFAIMRKVILEIPAIVLLNQVWPYYGMGCASSVSEFVLAIAAIVMMARIFREDTNESKES